MLEEKIGVNFWDIGLVTGFLDTIPKAKATEQ